MNITKSNASEISTKLHEIETYPTEVLTIIREHDGQIKHLQSNLDWLNALITGKVVLRDHVWEKGEHDWHWAGPINDWECVDCYEVCEDGGICDRCIGEGDLE